MDYLQLDGGGIQEPHVPKCLSALGLGLNEAYDIREESLPV